MTYASAQSNSDTALLPSHAMEKLDNVYKTARAAFETGLTRPLAYRRQQIIQLASMVQENIAALQDALHADLGKDKYETVVFDLAGVTTACRYALDNLEEWIKPDTPQLTDARAAWNPTVYKVPKGLVLIIGTWNYPSGIVLCPLVGAMAAGCACVVKGSELAPATARLLTDLFPRYLDPSAYMFISGAIPETTYLLERRWDHILYTGGKKAGRIVAQAAAKHLTPVTLELGGKSPVVIAEDADIELAARRVLYGKLQNSGQLCVSPDHVYVPCHLQESYISATLKAYHEFWPKGPFHEEAQWGNIVHPGHHARLRDILTRTRGKIVIGGECDGDKRLAPTIVKNVPSDDALMEDEIFGPILPIIPVNDVDESIRMISQQPIPLAVYVFTNDDDVKQKLLERTKSGAFTVNDTVSQLAIHEMPFGGQGDSGYGSWYGKNTFDTFTHLRSSITVPLAAEPFMSDRYPPYTEERYRNLIAMSGLTQKLPEA